jgi:hypothetical protein
MQTLIERAWKKPSPRASTKAEPLGLGDSATHSGRQAIVAYTTRAVWRIPMAAACFSSLPFLSPLLSLLAVFRFGLSWLELWQDFPFIETEEAFLIWANLMNVNMIIASISEALD